MSFEIHVTSEIKKNEFNPITHIIKEVEYKKLANLLGWKTSQIDGDPVLGEGVKYYFTAHCASLKEAKKKMEKLVDTIKIYGWPLLRKKIEKIVLDERY